MMRRIKFLMVLVLVSALLAFITWPRWSGGVDKAHRKMSRMFTPPPIEPDKKVEPVTALPERFYPTARMHTLPLHQHLNLVVEVSSEEGEVASRLREDLSAYEVRSRLIYQVPRAARTLEELDSRGTALERSWPNLETLIQDSRVSPFYHSLYERKVTFLNQRLTHVREFPHRHNMYDCDTILEMTSADGLHRALLIQADMDVVTDGTDPDRTMEVDSRSPTFQPFTAYNWPRQTRHPHPLEADYMKEKAELELAMKRDGLSADERYSMTLRLRVIRQSLEAMKYRSTLVSSLDPFIVVPVFMTRESSAHAPKVGDYALVFYGEQIWPAVVGDTGPNSKVGEASLKIARQLDSSIDGSARSRPVSTLGVTYLIFNGSADAKMSPPDLQRWEQHCKEWFKKWGGDPMAISSWQAGNPVPASNAHTE